MKRSFLNIDNSGVHTGRPEKKGSRVDINNNGLYYWQKRLLLVSIHGPFCSGHPSLKKGPLTLGHLIRISTFKMLIDILRKQSARWDQRQVKTWRPHSRIPILSTLQKEWLKIRNQNLAVLSAARFFLFLVRDGGRGVYSRS